MSDRERRFVAEYLKSLNAEDAAIAAGYAVTTAKSLSYKWVTDDGDKPLVFEAIQKELKKQVQRTQIDADYVLRQAVKIHERCMGEEDFRPSQAIKALEVIAKHTNVRAFADQNLRIEHEMGDEVSKSLWEIIRTAKRKQVEE